MSMLGHTKIRKHFKDLIDRQAMPQTNLFYGLNGIGKKKVALELVASLFCKKNGKTEALFEEYQTKGSCGVCQACEMVAAWTHPDLYVLAPTPPKSLASKTTQVAPDTEVQSDWTLKVEQVQELKTKLIHFPLMADHQVVIIDDADKMTRTTSNSLLKILEEPRPNQIFILITSQLNAVLPTLRSRSSKTYFAPLLLDEVKQIVLSLVEEEAPDNKTLEFFMRAFNGSITPVLRAIEAGIEVSWLSDLMKDKRDFITITDTVKEVMQTEMDLSLFLQCLRQYNLESVKEKDNAYLYETEIFHKIKQAEHQLSRHVSKEFVLENLFM